MNEEKNMLEDKLKQLDQLYPLKEIDTKEYGNFRMNGMDFEVRAYDCFAMGRVSTMKGRSAAGIMEISTMIINPFEIDVPLFSYDLMKVMGNYTLFLEQYNTLVDAERKEKPFIDLSKKYGYLNDYPAKTNWYDSIRLSSFCKKGKKKDLDDFDRLFDEYYSLYLELCADALICDEEAKREKANYYRDGLIENGGPATDIFVKKWGKEKTQEFFKEVLFG